MEGEMIMSEHKNNTSEFVEECRELCRGYESGWDAKGELVVPHPLAVCAHKLGEAADRLEAEIERVDRAKNTAWPEETLN